MKTRILYLALLGLFMGSTSCNKEKPLPVSAEFTTNIQNNTLKSNEGFTVYLSEACGEFLTYFKGSRESDSYGTGNGRNIELGTDSMNISAYGTVGTYTFTLVATSYGNWGETVDQDVQSVDITVVAAE